MMKLYGAPICSTCREVKQLLDDKGIPYEYIDIRDRQTMTGKRIKHDTPSHRDLIIHSAVPEQLRSIMEYALSKDIAIVLKHAYLR